MGNTCDWCGKDIFPGAEVVSDQDTYGDALFCSKECCKAAEDFAETEDDE